MLPRLEARDELASVEAMSAAFGGMRREDRRRYLGRLRRTAGGARPAVKASPETLAMMGVAVVVVPAGEETSNG
jgi:hypothetical protein